MNSLLVYFNKVFGSNGDFANHFDANTQVTRHDVANCLFVGKVIRWSVAHQNIQMGCTYVKFYKTVHVINVGANPILNGLIR